MSDHDDIISTTSLANEGTTAAISIPAPTTGSVSRTIRLPPFSQKHTTSWFQRAEVHFRTMGVTDDTTKADLVMMILPEEVFNKISPWLSTKTDTVTYQELKKKLTATYTLSKPARAQRVLDLITTPMGDASPSEAWDELVGLLMLDEVDDKGQRREICLSREIFLRRLPQNIRAQIPNAEDIEMKALVNLADELHEAAKASRHAATTSVRVVEEQPEPVMEINAVHRQRPPFNRTRGPKQPPQRQQQPQQQQPHRRQHSSPELPNWCYYHRVFGSLAQKCTQPCRFPKN